MTIKTKTQPKKGAAKSSARKGPGPRIGEWLPWIGGTVVIVALAVLVWWGINRQFQGQGSGGLSDEELQSTTLAVVGSGDAPATLDLYEDFLCPACAGFEAQFGEQIGAAVKAGKLRVRFHMLHFLDSGSASKTYSSRAAGAALAVFQKAPDKFLDFHRKLFDLETQPQEHGSSDLSNDQLAQIAESVGAGAAAADIRSGAQTKAAVASAEDAANQLNKLLHGKVSTPTVLNQGKPVKVAPGWFDKIVPGSSPAQPESPAPKPAG